MYQFPKALWNAWALWLLARQVYGRGILFIPTVKL